MSALSIASVFGGPGSPAPVAVDVGAISAPSITTALLNVTTSILAPLIGVTTSVTTALLNASTIVCVGEITGTNVPDSVNTVNSGASNGDVLSYDSGLSRWKPVPPSGGVTPSFGFYTLTYSGGATPVSDIPLDTVGVSTTDLVLNTGTGELLVNTTGYYEIEGYANLFTTTSLTPQLEMVLNGVVQYVYVGNVVVGTTYGCVSGTAIIHITAGEILKLRAGGGSQLNNTTALTSYMSILRVA